MRIALPVQKLDKAGLMQDGNRRGRAAIESGAEPRALGKGLRWLFLVPLFLFALLTFPAGGRCYAQGFGVSVVNGIEVYRNSSPRSRIFGNRDFLSSASLCSQLTQNKARLEQELIAASAAVNPSLPSGVSIVRQSVALSPNCTAVANYAAGRINLNVTLPGNVFTFNVTTPGPLPQSFDPRLSIRFDIRASAQIQIPTGPRNGLSMSPVQIAIYNVQPKGENITGDLALAAAKLVGKITGQDFLGKLTRDRILQFDGVSRFLVPINSELAAQLPAMEVYYDPTTKVVVLRGLDQETPSGTLASFRTSNFPNRYIRHRNWLGYVEPIQNGSANLDATFKVVPGLAGRCVSFESVNYPGHFLRHQNSRLKLAPRGNDQLFREDATFCMVRGLAGSGVSFQSANYQDSYIRHRNFELWLDRFDGSDGFKKDATFEKVPALYYPPGPVR
jgi:hypothetical protein